MVDQRQIGGLRTATGGNDEVGWGRAISHRTLGSGDLSGQRVWICRGPRLPAWPRRRENRIGQSSRAGMLHKRLLGISTPGQQRDKHEHHHRYPLHGATGYRPDQNVAKNLAEPRRVC